MCFTLGVCYIEALELFPFGIQMDGDVSIGPLGGTERLRRYLHKSFVTAARDVGQTESLANLGE